MIDKVIYAYIGMFLTFFVGYCIGVNQKIKKQRR